MTEHIELKELTEEEIRAYGFEPWDGTKKGPPDDWKRGWKVLYRGGFVGSLSTESASHWEHRPDEDYGELDIIGYPTEESQRNQTNDVTNRS